MRRVIIALLMLANVSAYTASVDECGKADGITASGVMAVEGVTVAADHLPLGTVVRIDGWDYVVQDRLGGDYSDRLDIYMEDAEAAWSFGRRMMIVEVANDNI